jgi:uroporphyrinogen-III decarboxylase
MEKERSKMTREEKRQRRLKDHISGKGIKFRDAKAEKLYHERVTRQLKANMCQEPDRVPVSLPTGNYPAYYAGSNFKTMMYDYKACVEAWRKFMIDFYDDMDSFMGPGLVFSGTVMDIMDYKNYTWPGHGLGDDVNTFQFVEAQYMKAGEYDAFLKDPSDFGFRVITPRIVGAAEPLADFPPLNTFMGMPMSLTYPFARPKMRQAFKKMIAAGQEMQKQQKILMEFSRETMEWGFPAGRGGMGIAPFDVLGDFLRGTEGIAIDMFRQPEKLLEAIDMIYEINIKRYIETPGYTVSFPLHKGDDTFMSRKQFERFYWPSLKKTIDALIEEGIMVSLFAEGAYVDRLEYIGDFPKGWVTWMFDKTDMAKAKKMIGAKCCIAGNVPASIVITGTPKQVKQECRRLIETCAPGGGYILAGGCTATETRNPENFRVFMEAAREYGVYK